jgi:hypothetical protein
MSTSAACLTRIGRVDFDELASSFFRFGAQLTEECRPRDICNTPGKAMMVNPAIHVEVFDTDDPVGIDDLTAVLMGEVLSSKADTLMDTGNNLTVFVSLRCAICQLGMLALHFCQGFLFAAKETGVCNLFSIREGSKGFESYVNTDSLRSFGQSLRFTLDGEADVPLAYRGTADGTGLDFAFEGPMGDHFDTPNLGEAHVVIMGKTKTTLRKGEAIISALALKACSQLCPASCEVRCLLIFVLSLKCCKRSRGRHVRTSPAKLLRLNRYAPC